MFNPRRWELGERVAGPRNIDGIVVVDDAGLPVAHVPREADANLIRCAPDMHAFLVKLMDSGVLGRHGLLLGEAERLRHRAEGIRD